MGSRRPSAVRKPAREGDVIATSGSGDPIARYASSSPRVGVTGDIEGLALWAGRSAGLIDAVRPAGEIVRSLAEEAATALRTTTGLLRD